MSNPGSRRKGKKIKGHLTGRNRQSRPFLAAFGMVVAVAFFATVELGLFVFGVGDYRPLFVKQVDYIGREWVITNSDVGLNWFSYQLSESFNTKPRFQRFKADKEKGGYRIFVVGESAAAGWPLDENAGWSKMLEFMLNKVQKERKVEIINCGLTASTVSMYPFFMKEIKPYKPDLIILYAGHNEFYGVREPNRLLGLRISRLIARAFKRNKKVDTRKSLMEIRSDHQIAPESGDNAVARKRFESDLTRFIKSAKGTPLLIYKMCSNEELAPFGSYTPSGRDEGSKQAEKIVQLIEEAPFSPPDNALEELKDFLKVLPRHASVHHALALCYLSDGEIEKARQHFKKSIDLDTIPFRAKTFINEVIDSTVNRYSDRQVRFCETEPAFRKVSKRSVIGYDLFLDHVHPSIYGNYLIAREGVKIIVNDPLFQFANDDVEIPEFSDVLAGLNISEVDEYVALTFLKHTLYNRPPFKGFPGEKYVLELFAVRKRELFKQFSPVIRHCLSEYEKTEGQHEVHTLILSKTDLNSDIDNGVLEARRAVYASPNSGSAHYNLAYTLYIKGKMEEAREQFYQALTYGYRGRRAIDLAKKLNININ
jgi:lysophospholipase L1-like esterase